MEQKSLAQNSAELNERERAILAYVMESYIDDDKSEANDTIKLHTLRSLIVETLKEAAANA